MTRLANHPGRKAAAKLAKDDRDAKILELRREGVTIKKIATQLGVSEDTIGRVIGKTDMDEKKCQAKDLYEKGYTAQQIAKILKVGINTVGKWKRENFNNNSQIPAKKAYI